MLPINQCIRRYASDQPNPCRHNLWDEGDRVFPDLIACTRTWRSYCDVDCAISKCDHIDGKFDKSIDQPFTCYVDAPMTTIDSSCDFPPSCDLKEYQSPLDIHNWGDAVAFCEGEGMQLASYSDICPCGEHREPKFGSKEGNHWVAASTTDSEESNTWIQVGKEHNTCVSFSQLHNQAGPGPDDGIDSTKQAFESNFLYCCA
jgi:hypothetical protein